MIAGVYKIENMVNGKVYIGQSRDIVARWAKERRLQVNPHLRSAFTKHGVENFEFSILKSFDNPQQLLLDFYETTYIQVYDSQNPEKGYNLKGGGSHGTHSEETKQKLRDAATGVVHTEASKVRLSQTWKTLGHPKGMLGKPHSEATRAKMSLARKNVLQSAEHRATLASRNRDPEVIKKQNESRQKTRDRKKLENSLLIYRDPQRSIPNGN